jgi:inosose dehydratase
VKESKSSRRLAGAPISWGVCEVPGWGHQMAPARVLREMSELGLRATELGPVGYLPLDPAELRGTLDQYELGLVGGFVPLVLHQEVWNAARDLTARMARLLAGAGADVFVAAILADADWRAPHPLTETEWGRLVSRLAALDAIVAGEGLRLAVHPHVGTLIEHDREVRRLVASADVGWCLDTGHMLIGSTDAVEFVEQHGDRVAHVHLKDVDASIAARVRGGELSLIEATQHGLFRPLGQGDARIDEVLHALDDASYEGWLVLEQDTAITGSEPPAGDGPALDVRASIEFLARRRRLTRRA